MKLKYLLLFTFLLVTNYSFSCDCKPIDRENMVEIGLKHEIVFYGEVIKVDSVKRSYTFRIIELFKGKYNSQFITQKYSGNCSVIPSVKQLWIVYANFNNDKTIEVSGCSPSTGFNPSQNAFPPPPPPLISDPYKRKEKHLELLSESVWKLQLENQNLMDCIYQLERLRAYKKSQEKISDKEKTDIKLETYSQYIIISLIVNILLFLSLLFVILKKKNLSK